MNGHETGPSRLYYGLAALVFVAGWVLFALVLFKNLSGLESKLQQVVVPGKAELNLARASTYTIYYEYQSAVGSKIYSTGRSLSGLECVVTSKATSEKLRVSPTTVNSSYSLGSRSGVGVFDFTIDRPGIYVLSAQYAEGREGPEVVLAVGEGFTTGILTTVFGGLAIVFGSMGAAVVIALVTFLKRVRAERALRRPDAQYRPIE
jgi:hypothetical protein